MIKTLVTNREWGKFSHTQVASAVKACLGRTEVAKRLLFISFAVVASFACQTANAQATASTWTGSTPAQADGQTVYLYNVGAKQYLGKGGHWGTEATMNLEGTPFKLTCNTNGTFVLQSLVKGANGSTTNGKLTLMDGTEATSQHDSFDYFVDGNPKPASSYPNYTFTAAGSVAEGYTFAITSVTNTTYPSVMAGKTFYMFAEGANGHVSPRLETASSTMLGIPADSANYSKWVIVTEDQRKEAFQNVNNAHVNAVNATFLMYDFDFARNDNACEFWKTDATTDGSTTGTLSYSGNKQCKPEDAYPKTTTVYTYTYTSTHKIYKNGSTTHTSTITTTEDHGDTWVRKCDDAGSHWDQTSPQNVTYTRDNSKTVESTTTTGGYTYYLGNGYMENGNKIDYETGTEYPDGTNMVMKSYGGAWTANIHGKRGSVVQTIKADNMQKEGWYRISCVGFTTTTKGIARLYAASGKGNNGTGSDATAETEKFATKDLKRIDAATRPTTYVAASKLLDNNVNTFNASVRVYVSKSGTGYETLSFGIQVGSAANATQDADDDAWTCFDNFKIEYLGTPENEIILDEDQTDGGYINAQAWDDNKTVQKSIVYLHRTMNTEKWNSLVLPINLTVGQVKSIFGGDVRISEFYGAKADHPQRIVFDPITVDRNDDDIAIEEGKLYLVKPGAQGGMPTNKEAKEIGGNKFYDYYTIIGVTFKQKKEVEGVNYSNRVEGKTGSEEFGTQKEVKFVGTYVKCFDNDLIPTNSYVLNGNNMGGTAGLWYYRTVETKTKGFRGWLEPANDLPSKGFEYEIEGVVDQVNGDVTAIDGIEAEQQHNANIYNLNGQLVRQGATSTEGLPSGLYIVGGKKVVVK
ncbi:T9SS type A sorting domain-containing protein [Hallella sp.]|uniref:T9SS type A sorting domain-containing protein n=1 Tax=Hallella sp. TaxID=2980186 RepID=UPI0030796610